MRNNNSGAAKLVAIVAAVVIILIVGISIYSVMTKDEEEPISEATPTPTEAQEEATPTLTPTPTPETYPVREAQSVLGTRLSERYKDNFYVGTCVAGSYLSNPTIVSLLLEQFNSLTCENEMKPEALLNQQLCVAKGEVTVIFPKSTKTILDWAYENNFAMRGHVLVWYSQTPDWFYREGFHTSKPYVGREEMLKRMESYIRQVLEYCETNYPGMFYAWDVVNEAYSDNGDKLRDCQWLQIVGKDYIEQAFVFARKYASEGTKLFYNDFNCYIPTKMNNIFLMAKTLQEKGLIDGIGMQSHLDVGYPSASQYLQAVKFFSNGGFEVQITELDITTQPNEAGWERQARVLEDIFKNLVSGDLIKTIDLTSVTIWGINDSRSWRNSQDPLLLDDNLKPKKAYFSVLQQQ